MFYLKVPKSREINVCFESGFMFNDFAQCACFFIVHSFSELNATDLINRICSTMELKFYIGSISEDGGSNFLKPNKNYNLMAWVPGCEPGLLAVLPQILLKVPRIYLKRP